MLLPRPSSLPLAASKRGVEEENRTMERRGGCCIAMYGAAGGSADVAWKVGRIMLRYRPIAPRPACAATAAGSAAVSAAPTEPCAPARRPKRKRRANSSSGSGGRGRKVKKTEASATAVSISSFKEDEKSSSSSSSSASTVVTLPLMPETPERKGEPSKSLKLSPDPSSAPAALAPAWLWQGNGERSATAGLVVVPRSVRALGPCVTVECVTDTWREGEVHWRSDEGVRVALAADDCPGFVSDEWDRITWTNEAYRAMVVGSSASSVAARGVEEEEREDVTAGLVTQGLLAAAGACRAFTCRVRVRYPRRPGRDNTSSLAVPCDVWRMDGGGCAWRLDVKTALSLSF